MALNSSGTLRIGGTAGQSVNLELGKAANATTNLGSTEVRTLAGVASGAISFSDLYGKTVAPPTLANAAVTIPTTDSTWKWLVGTPTNLLNVDLTVTVTPYNNSLYYGYLGAYSTVGWTGSASTLSKNSQYTNTAVIPNNTPTASDSYHQTKQYLRYNSDGSLIVCVRDSWYYQTNGPGYNEYEPLRDATTVYPRIMVSTNGGDTFVSLRTLPNIVWTAPGSFAFGSPYSVESVQVSHVSVARNTIFLAYQTRKDTWSSTNIGSTTSPIIGPAPPHTVTTTGSYNVYSTDGGVTWTNTSVPAHNSCAIGNGKYVFSNGPSPDGGTPSATIYCSSDLATFTSVTLIAKVRVLFFDDTTAKFYAVVGVTYAENLISSSDGLTWSIVCAIPKQTGYPTGNVTVNGYIKYGTTNILYGFANGDYLAYSDDFVNWNLFQSATISGSITHAAVYNGSLFVQTGTLVRAITL